MVQKDLEKSTVFPSENRSYFNWFLMSVEMLQCFLMWLFCSGRGGDFGFMCFFAPFIVRFCNDSRRHFRSMNQWAKDTSTSVLCSHRESLCLCWMFLHTNIFAVTIRCIWTHRHQILISFMPNLLILTTIAVPFTSVVPPCKDLWKALK